VLEKQFRGYYKEATASGKTGENLLRILESRLDNVVYRAGFAKSRDMARQLVRHGHFVVNGKKVDIPSYRVSEHDIIEVREKSRRDDAVRRGPRRGTASAPSRRGSRSSRRRCGSSCTSSRPRAVIDTPVQEQLIVELYSK
jgi:small subunit ribosomal protein S4